MVKIILDGDDRYWIIPHHNVKSYKRGQHIFLQTMEVQLHTTERGKDLLIVDGFTYYEKRKLKSDEIVWHCSKEKKCSAKIYTHMDKTTISRLFITHSHEKDEWKIQMKILNESTKRKAEDILERPSKIIHSAIEENPTCLQNLSARDVTNLRQSIFRKRRKQMMPSLTNNREETIEKLIDFKMLEAIKYQKGKLQILNQLLLPKETRYEEICSVTNGWEAIKAMKVRGAPAISIVAALSLAVELESKSFDSKAALHEYVVDKLQYLMSSRPTAVNLKQVIDAVIKQSKIYLDCDDTNQDDANQEIHGMQTRLCEVLETLLEKDIEINRSIGKYGGEYILKNCEGPLTLLTHCNTGSLATAGYGTALGVIRWLYEQNKLEHAFCTETRPYNQGARLTAYELVHDNIPATLICDSMVAALMKSRKISAVVVGADRVVANGDTANKIGTYQIAICAKYHGVPFFVASPTSTLDFSLEDGSQIPIEERPAQELTSINSIPIAAEGINCWNPAFDVTPASLITGGIITECGVFPANALKQHKQKLSSLKLFSKS